LVTFCEELEVVDKSFHGLLQRSINSTITSGGNYYIHSDRSYKPSECVQEMAYFTGQSVRVFTVSNIRQNKKVRVEYDRVE